MEKLSFPATLILMRGISLLGAPEWVWIHTRYISTPGSQKQLRIIKKHVSVLEVGSTHLCVVMVALRHLWNCVWIWTMRTIMELRRNIRQGSYGVVSHSSEEDQCGLFKPRSPCVTLMTTLSWVLHPSSLPWWVSAPRGNFHIWHDYFFLFGSL